MKPIELCAADQCTGCGACQAVCPRSAISLAENDLGCLLPEISQSLCIRCGRCTQVCPVLHPVEKRMPQKAYAGCCINSLRLNSASGGISAALSHSFLQTDASAVCGAAYRPGSFQENNACVEHILITSADELDRIQGSKYVQSDSAAAYQQILQSLADGKRVLFFGTPCQVAGVLNLTPERYRPQLFTVDLICHGVCGRGFFRDYINYLRRKKNVVAFSFRDKTRGWGLNCRITSETASGTLSEQFLSCSFSSYYQIFLKSHMYRENCYSCRYACQNRCSDLTIGDYWGIEEEHPELCQRVSLEKGISCILVNTARGQQLLEQTSQLVLLDSTLEQISRHNAQLLHPSTPGDKRALYTALYTKQGYPAVDHWFKRHDIPFTLFLRRILSPVKQLLKK